MDLVVSVRAWARGMMVTNAPPELALYARCKRWNVLPNAGGWYDQDPYVREFFTLIDSEVDKVTKEQQRKKK